MFDNCSLHCLSLALGLRLVHHKIVPPMVTGVDVHAWLPSSGFSRVLVVPLLLRLVSRLPTPLRTHFEPLRATAAEAPLGGRRRSAGPPRISASVWLRVSEAFMSAQPPAWKIRPPPVDLEGLSFLDRMRLAASAGDGALWTSPNGLGLLEQAIKPTE